jgi:hypothetical protein
MESIIDIHTPKDESDSEVARRVFEEFTLLYRPTLERVGQYLEDMMETKAPAYAEAYAPWHSALKTLVRGTYLVSRKVPLPNPEAFIEAVRMFSFEGTIQFLRDVCLSCQLKLVRNWEDKFREHINLLLTSLAILLQKREPNISR